MFVCLGFFISLENFSLIWRRHHCRSMSANIDLCSALMAIKHWGFLSVPHLLWHRSPVYNDHLRGPVTLIPVAERFSNVAVTTCFYDLGLSRLGFEHSTFGKRCECIQTLNYWELSSKQTTAKLGPNIWWRRFPSLVI